MQWLFHLVIHCNICCKLLSHCGAIFCCYHTPYASYSAWLTPAILGTGADSMRNYPRRRNDTGAIPPGGVRPRHRQCGPAPRRPPDFTFHLRIPQWKWRVLRNRPPCHPSSPSQDRATLRSHRLCTCASGRVPSLVQRTPSPHSGDNGQSLQCSRRR